MKIKLPDKFDSLEEAIETVKNRNLSKGSKKIVDKMLDQTIRYYKLDVGDFYSYKGVMYKVVKKPNSDLLTLRKISRESD